MGSLPPGWPPEVPLPNGARLLGSVAASFGDFRSGYAEAVLDADGAPHDVLSAYQAELGRHGWAPYELPRPPRAFVSGESAAGERQSFLRTEDGPVLQVTVLSRDELPSDVRVRLDANGRKPRGQLRGHHSLAIERIPTLQAPSRVLLTPSGGGGGSEREWTARSTARTGMAVGELEAHFASQLSEAGWTRLGRGDDGVVAWSSWRLPGDQEWKGLLLVDAAFVEDQRSLMVRIEAQRDTGDSFFATTTSSSTSTS